MGVPPVSGIAPDGYRKFGTAVMFAGKMPVPRCIG
jgi:hypothetical protein